MSNLITILWKNWFSPKTWNSCEAGPKGHRFSATHSCSLESFSTRLTDKFIHYRPHCISEETYLSSKLESHSLGRWKLQQAFPRVKTAGAYSLLSQNESVEWTSFHSRWGVDQRLFRRSSTSSDQLWLHWWSWCLACPSSSLSSKRKNLLVWSPARSRNHSLWTAQI